MKLVFDFGGVLFNWHPPSLLRRELPHRAPDEASAKRWVREFFQGYDGDWAEFDRGTVEPPALVRRIAARTGLAEHEVQRVIDGVPAELQPIVGTVDLLRRLRAGGRTLFYLSNMPAPYADHLEREHEFVGWFEAGVFSARVRAIKPEPAIYALAAERFGPTRPSCCSSTTTRRTSRRPGPPGGRRCASRARPSARPSCARSVCLRRQPSGPTRIRRVIAGPGSG